jgi:septation ring formation regulator EzrA
VEEAQKRVLQYLQQIESIQQEKKNIDQQIDLLYKTHGCEEVRSQVTQLRAELEKKLPLIENNIGCFCTSIFEYRRNMEVYYLNDSEGGFSKWQEMTLQELILTTDPTIKEISCVSFNSYLNG